MLKSADEKRSFLFTIILTAATIALLTGIFWAYTQDDVFITYTYSRNIAEGQGFVFNPGEHVQGTTTPLYTLLMAVAYLLTPDLLHAGNLLSAVFLLITCVLAIQLTRSDLSAYGQAAIALTLAVSPLIYVSFGMETLLYCALLMLAFWLWKQNRRPAAMLTAAALTWTRADGVVLGGTLWLLAAWEAWRNHYDQTLIFRLRRHPWLLGIIYLLAIAPWFGFAWAYFGTPLPNTFSAKQELLRGVKFWTDGFGWWKAFYGNNPLSLLALPLIGLGMWRAAIQPRLRPLTLWAILFAAGYTALNVTAFWYYTPLVVVLIVLAAFGGEWLARDLIRRCASRIAVVGVSAALVLVSGILAVIEAWRYGPPPPRITTYTLVGEWIEQNTDPAGVLLVGDLGIMGYHARRHTIDSPGLITPQMFYKLDSYAAVKFKPDYVVATGYWTWQRLVEQDWFKYHYLPLTQISTPGDDFSPITVYQRRLALETPVQAIQGFDLPLNCPLDLQPGDALPSETRARLLLPSGETEVEVSHPFLWNQYPASPATLSDHLREQIALPLTVSPGRYSWEVDCGNIVRGEIEVLPVASAPGYVAMTPVQQWADFARLDGLVLPEGSKVWSGGTLTVALPWVALRPADQDYSVFLHLLDANGNLAAQSDGYPRDGSRPTTSWQAGETIVDIRYIQLPANLPEGEYTLTVGWYDWRTGDRLPLADGSDTLKLPVTLHNRWPGGSGLP